MIGGLSTIKLVGGLVAALILLALIGERARWMHRAHVAEAQALADCTATRAASGRPKLKCDETDEQIQFLGDALNAVKAKTEAARALDQANKTRVEGEQASISKERGSSYEARIADARARAGRVQPVAARRADPGRGGTARLPSVPAPAVGTPAAAAQTGLSAGDALIATEQAIQLDELIKWVNTQHAVSVNGPTPQH